MRNIVLVILLVAVTRAQQKYKLCAPADSVYDNTCIVLQKGDNQISCVRVADSAECAIRLAQGEADFGVFNAEELLLAHKFYPSRISPILQLRHKDKMNEQYEFQTVAVMAADLTLPEKPPGTDYSHLKNGGLCHPGFSKSQWWNDHILKYFEKKVNRPTCQENVSVIENEIKSLKDFFGKACRPGTWTTDSTVDAELKKKYPELCALCDQQANCSYSNDAHHGHAGALECLSRRRGKVAYVALSHVRRYLGRNDTFQFLCPAGNTLPLSTETPCAWLKQPWSVIAARKEIANFLKNPLLEWLQPKGQKEPWKIALNKIIQEDSWAINMPDTSLSQYLGTARDLDFLETTTCDRTIRWCTIGDLDTNKCKWVAAAAMNLGVEPRISCVKSNCTFECLRNLAEKRADIFVIDSNYGYLARTVYGLSTDLYCETEKSKNSVTLAMVREPQDDNYPVKSFQDLKGRAACFPEYGGISWLSFVKVARTDDIIPPKDCNYASTVSKLLSGACTPGIKDNDHSRTTASTDVSSKLCSACMYDNNTSCAANETNLYYGDKGALRCLSDGAGDVAFVEAANINDGSINLNKYRILCKNGSLAKYPGFNFDEICALSVTIDSELMGRKNESQISKRDTFLALLKIEDWLGYRAYTKRPIHVYGPFNGTLDLLFKDSTSALVSTSSQEKAVLEYKELFRHVDSCSSGSSLITVNLILIALVALYEVLFNHVH